MTQDTPQNLLKGSVYVIIAFFFMAVFGIITKVAAANGSSLWISFITYLAATAGMMYPILKNGINFLKTEHFLLHLGRGTFGLAASFLYMLSMQYIPIVNATLLFNTAPIFIPLLAIAFVKVSISLRTWLAIAIGFLGIIVIIKPTAAILTQSGDLLGIASGISLAIAYLLIKLMTPTEPQNRIVFYYFFIGTCIQLPCLIFAGPLPSWELCFLAALAGAALMIAQIFLVKGYTFAPVSQVGIYQYTSIVFVAILNWFIWNDVPPLSDLLGVLLVFVAAFIIIRSKNETPSKANF